MTNTGKFSGKEVVQVYIAKPQGKLGKPAKELAAFEKTRELQPGESQLMILTWEINDMASYDDLGKVKKSAYVLEAGSYDIYVGTSVRDVTKADYSYILNHDVITEQLSAKLVPTSLPKRMLADGSYEALPQSEPVDTDYSAIGNIDPSLTEGVAPGQRAIPYFRFADGMAKTAVTTSWMLWKDVSRLMNLYQSFPSMISFICSADSQIPVLQIPSVSEICLNTVFLLS